MKINNLFMEFFGDSLATILTNQYGLAPILPNGAQTHIQVSGFHVEDGVVIGINLNANKQAGEILVTLANYPTKLNTLQYILANNNKEVTSFGLQPNDMPELGYLDISGCSLTELTQPLNNLQTLYAQGNAIKEMSLGSCPYLEILDSSNNQLTKFETLGNCDQLHSLYLYNNRLPTIDITHDLPNLETLHLQKNKLNNFPAHRQLKFKNLKQLYLQDNPLADIPKDYHPTEFIYVAENSIDFWNDQIEFRKGNTKNTRVKIVLIGNGRVGKTSLYKRLAGKDFEPNEPSTHKIERYTLDITHLNKVEIKDFTASLWDFGGQAIYLATHQFFLTPDALYLIVSTDDIHYYKYCERDKPTTHNSTVEQPPKQKEYWIDMVNRHAGNSPIIFVHTHAKKRNFTTEIVNQKECYAINFNADPQEKDYDKYLEDLQDKITDNLNEHPNLLGELIAKTYNNLRLAIEELSKIQPKITKQKFDAICKDCEIDDNNYDSALQYLVRKGVVIHISKQEGLKNTIFIDPDWLLERVYKIIDNDLIGSEGRFRKSFLLEILKEGNDTLEDTNTKANELLELLTHFKLIFEDKDPEEKQENERYYVAPQYLSAELRGAARILKNLVMEKLNKKPGFYFRFPNFVPDHLMVQFVSTYGPLANQVYWRNGICFSGQNTIAVLELDEANNTLSIFSDGSMDGQRLERQVFDYLCELSGKNTKTELSIDGTNFINIAKLKDHDLQKTAISCTNSETESIANIKRFVQKIENNELRENIITGTELINPNHGSQESKTGDTYYFYGNLIYGDMSNKEINNNAPVGVQVNGGKVPDGNFTIHQGSKIELPDYDMALAVKELTALLAEMNKCNTQTTEAYVDLSLVSQAKDAAAKGDKQTTFQYLKQLRSFGYGVAQGMTGNGLYELIKVLLGV
jgi:internalin A